MGTCLMMQEGLVDRLYEVDCRRDMDDCYSMRDVILRRDYDGRRRMADRWKDVQTMILGNWAVAVERLSRIRCDDSGGLFLLLARQTAIKESKADASYHTMLTCASYTSAPAPTRTRLL